MSYTRIVGTAKCRVVEDFDLNEFIMSTADWIGNNVDAYNENLSANDKEVLKYFGDRTYESVCDNLSDYLNLIDDQLLIEVNSEDQNIMMWDWLTNLVLHSVMASNIMEITTNTGTECDVCYYNKKGDLIGSDDVFVKPCL